MLTNNNKSFTDVGQSNIANNEINKVCNKHKDISAFFDENQENLYPIIEKVEGLENYLEYLEKLEYELNEKQYDVKKNLYIIQVK